MESETAVAVVANFLCPSMQHRLRQERVQVEKKK